MTLVIAISIFLITYALMITEKINRAIVSLLGALLMILLGILDIHKVFAHYIEWNTLALLIGMMILVGITNQTGIFQYLAIRLAKLAHGYPIRILVFLSLLTAFLSAFLDNVTTVLLIVPVTFSITRILQVHPVPFLISEVIASNIGGTATLIGDPPNIMIGSANSHLSFNAFLIHLGPVVLLILAVIISLLYLIYRKPLQVSEQRRLELMKLDENESIQDRKLMTQSLIVLGLTILGFLLHSSLQLEASVIAILGATLLMFIACRKEEDIEKAFASVEWVTIFFFAGLFTLVGGLQEVGVIQRLALGILEITNGNIPLTATLVLWGSGIASGIIDNIPFVATMIPLIKDMAAGLGLSVSSPEINSLWWSLALGACLGGNATLIGASANIIVAGLASKEGKGFSFMEFLKIGAPLTLVSLILAHIYLYFRYYIFL